MDRKTSSMPQKEIRRPRNGIPSPLTYNIVLFPRHLNVWNHVGHIPCNQDWLLGNLDKTHRSWQLVPFSESTLIEWVNHLEDFCKEKPLHFPIFETDMLNILRVQGRARGPQARVVKQCSKEAFREQAGECGWVGRTLPSSSCFIFIYWTSILWGDIPILEYF